MLLHASGNRTKASVYCCRSPQYPQKGSQKVVGKTSLCSSGWPGSDRGRVTELHRFHRVVRKPSLIWYWTQKLSNSVMTVTFKPKYIIREDKKLQERGGNTCVKHAKKKNHWNVHTASYPTHKKSHRMVCSMLTKPHQTLKAVRKAGKFPSRTHRTWAHKLSEQIQSSGPRTRARALLSPLNLNLHGTTNLRPWWG